MLFRTELPLSVIPEICEVIRDYPVGISTCEGDTIIAGNNINKYTELTARINLVLEEAVSNVIKHGYEPGADGSVDIEAKVGKDSLEFTLTDTGVPFDPTEAPMPDTNLGVEERPIGGLGVYLIRTIMDSVSYRREGGRNILTLTKRI